MIAVAVPIALARIARETGHVALMLAFTGLAMGLGATISTALAGALADTIGFGATFAVLAGIATLATLVIAVGTGK